MAIGVNDLWLAVRDLSRKDHAGYTSSDEFNRILVQAQALLAEYYLETVHSNARSSSALRPLFTVVDLSPASSLYYNLPADFMEKAAVQLRFVRSNGTATPTIERYPADILHEDEAKYTITSAVRRPRLDVPDSYAVQFLNGQIYVPMDGFTGKVTLSYWKYPPTATRAYSLNLTTQEEEYDAGSSIDLVWNIQDLPNFVDLMLFHKGIAIRDSEILSWVAAKKGLSLIPEQVRDFSNRKN